MNTYNENQIKYYQNNIKNVLQEMNERTKINNINDLLEMINQYFNYDNDIDEKIYRLYHNFFCQLNYNNAMIKRYREKLI